ncbi:hypothetical protein D1872_311620 [compost metagenome]
MGLPAENPDDRHPLNRLVDNRVDFAEPGTNNRVVLRGELPIEHDPSPDNRYDKQTDHAEPDVEQEEGHINPEHVDDAREEVGEDGDK